MSQRHHFRQNCVAGACGVEEAGGDLGETKKTSMVFLFEDN